MRRCLRECILQVFRSERLAQKRRSRRVVKRRPGIQSGRKDDCNLRPTISNMGVDECGPSVRNRTQSGNSQLRVYLFLIADNLEIDMTKEKVRRTRGPSPRGDFEQSKKAALAAIDAVKESERVKTARLKAMRLAMSQSTAETRNT
jgi:hypothetical protein